MGGGQTHTCKDSVKSVIYVSCAHILSRCRRLAGLFACVLVWFGFPLELLHCTVGACLLACLLCFVSVDSCMDGISMGRLLGWHDTRHIRRGFPSH